MCFSSGGGGGPKYAPLWNPETQSVIYAEQGVPLDYAKRGITSVTQYQVAAQQDLSDKQMAAQKAIADQQQAFNQQQFDYQKQLADKQQAETVAQANRQNEYDTGRNQLLAEGADKINASFAQFNDDYFNNLAKSYTAKAQDQVDYQKGLAQKQVQFNLARQGLIDSQAGANQAGLLEEQAGRTMAEQAAAAQDVANQRRQQVAGAKSNLLSQVQQSESIGSPIAASDEPGVQTALQTQRSAISGVTNQAGDVTASLQGVPTVSTLSNIFANLIQGGAGYLGGKVAAQGGLGGFNAGLAGTSPR